ncbi:MAG: hypothetical protein CO031_01335 [Candidatus Nealsonbacteria bacterium CG_4_9_14_0_2_um_filter_37_38]|uniref:Uncharacterized protein n=1 Tax=Candidatus Nealsonbacteria bacterium CG_4_10_14_0_8_um_filter_37_14 TaxID=1974684 RepID=A0A2M7R6K1_9BACT|nr:MAG: hypothetical protein COV63_01100 [Candidatus Nealsonbacteria bacterium CG11_big_fil_rev_8_21_14_0_20_37_68]PIW92317.1 MAG: hypothetical protein COZ89_00460 [Candidatus Nealsonbacteria bacterium CG_4_8_14_3_um_filter_37_23]PIY89263.1 MAG: hypothetical protein COY73_01410 [Candidatus Nealsonbacteria bacterium CG_4_10_14_0_8_um_filter_37_14]PJC51676.1 MAG: hypothetical protein CO031_01335 [Candidatus Nealsonbacteria bacterium CG_4_9_14_0_2_um_filter_37_38]
MNQSFSKIWIIVVLIVLITGGILAWKPPILKEVITDCVLSLCDCKCHPEGKTPEKLRGVLCGVNCEGIYGIEDCKLKSVFGINFCVIENLYFGFFKQKRL